MEKLIRRLGSLKTEMRAVGNKMKNIEEEEIKLHGLEMLGAADKVQTWIDGIQAQAGGEEL